MNMEVLKQRVTTIENEMKEIKSTLKELDDKIDNNERNIMEKVDKNQQDIKQILKDNELHQKEKSDKLYDKIDKLTDAQYQQTLIQKDMQNELKTNVRDFTELAKELKENDKWKSRTIAGFVVSIILMIVGTFWKMIVGISIFLPFLF